MNTTVKADTVRGAIEDGLKVVGMYRSLLKELSGTNAIPKKSINELAGDLSGLSAPRLSEAHPPSQISSREKASKAFAGIQKFCTAIDKWSLVDLRTKISSHNSRWCLVEGKSAKILNEEMRQLASAWNARFLGVTQHHVETLFTGVIPGYRTTRGITSGSAGSPAPSTRLADFQGKTCDTRASYAQLSGDGPRMPRIANLELDFLEEGGNRGSPETPVIDVQLHFGLGERVDMEDCPLHLELSDCRIRICHTGGEIGPSLPGDHVKFILRYTDAETLEIKNIDLEFDPLGTTAWYSLHGTRHRKLYGSSNFEHLCTFNKRPETLSVLLEANPYDFRLVDNKKQAGHRADEVDRVLAVLTRNAALGPPDQAGYYVLDSRRIIE